MRVLVLHNSGSSKLPSGELRVAEEDVRGLKRAGVDARLEVVHNDELDRLGPVPRVVAGLGLLWSPKAYRWTTAALTRFRPHIVHFHAVLPRLTVSSLAACRRFGVPVVQTLHNYRWICVEGGLYRRDAPCDACLRSGSLQGVRYRCSRNSLPISALLTANNALWVRRGKLFRWADRFLAVSKFVREMHVKAGFPPERVVVKYNSIDIGSLPQQPVPASERSGVAFVGRLSPSKGTSTLARILPMLRDTAVDILGEGTERPRLESVIGAHGLENVRLRGRVAPEEVRRVVARAACVLAPSTFPDPLNLVAIEALGLGTPVVASRIGGITEVVQDSGGGISVDPGDAEGFAAAVRDLCRSPSRIEELGRRGRAHVERHFSTAESTERLLETYETLRRTADDGPAGRGGD